MTACFPLGTGATTTVSDCTVLATLRIVDANLLSASFVPASGNLPEHCRVLGVIRPAINFEVRLPARDWNGRFYMAGCGGFCGRLDSDLPGFTNAMNHGLRRGYAAATMDSGHWGAHRADGRWAWNDRLAENDWGWRGVTETARVARALVATNGAWVAQANQRPDGTEILDRSKIGLIAAAVVSACDARDGRTDGVIDKWYAGPRDASGKQLYPGGVPHGSEPYWPLWLTGKPGDRMPSLVPLFAQDFLRYMAFAEDPGETYRVQDFDFERDPPRLAQMGGIYNTDSPDLGAYAGRGGKLIVYHGWTDPIVTPWRTLQYVEGVQRRMDGPEKTDSFLRLFMLPGFDHCGLQTGPGADDAGFDPLPAPEAWVERGVAPDSIRTARIGADGAVQWNRPVCPHPASAGCGH